MQKWLTEFAMKMSDCPLLGSRVPHLHRHGVAFLWHLSTCYFPPLTMHARGVMQPLYGVDARNRRGTGSSPSQTGTLHPLPTLPSAAQSSSVILAAEGKKSPSLSVFFLILCWITFSVHSWKCHPVERYLNYVLLQAQSFFPLQKFAWS